MPRLKRLRRSCEATLFHKPLYRVLKKVWPDLEISVKAMAMLERMVKGMVIFFCNRAMGFCPPGKDELSNLHLERAIRSYFMNDKNLGEHLIQFARSSLERSMMPSPTPPSSPSETEIEGEGNKEN